MRRTLLQRFFGLLYTRLAWGYDVVAWLASAGHWYRWVEAAIPIVNTGPVLEVGCGRGRLLRPLAERGHQVTGVDYSGEMARHAAQESGQPVLQGDGRVLPFRDGQFATLVTTFPAPYVLEGETQREFARVVRPGGLWLWVDAPALNSTASTALARLVMRAAEGKASDDEVTRHLSQDRSDGLWSVRMERVSVGPTTVAVRIARRMVEDG